MGDISVNSYFLLNLFIFIQICTSIDLGHGFKKANTVIFLTFEKNRYVFSVIQVLIQLYWKYILPSLFKKYCMADSLLKFHSTALWIFHGQIHQEHLQFPQGLGTFCYFLQNISPHSGTFVTFWRLLKTNLQPHPGVGGRQPVNFDWCAIALYIISFIRIYLIYCPGPGCSKADKC